MAPLSCDAGVQRALEPINGRGRAGYEDDEAAGTAVTKAIVLPQRLTKNGVCAIAAPRRRLDTYQRRSAGSRCDESISYYLRNALSSTESSLATAFAHSSRDFGFVDDAVRVIPARIGHCTASDLAARVFVNCHDYVFHRTAVTMRNYKRSHGVALHALNRALSDPSVRKTDAVLVAIAILICSDTAIQETGLRSIFVHYWGGGIWTLAQTHDGKQASDVTRILLYINWYSKFTLPCAAGFASAYEHDHWLAQLPTSAHAAPGDIETARLRVISHQLFCRLPRLIAAVRSLRSYEDELPRETFAAAVRLATELLQLDGGESECALLHRISIRRTANDTDALIVPYSFHVADWQLFEALCYFWQTNILLNRLCSTLCRIALANDQPVDFGRDYLSSRNINYARNLLMALPSATALGSHGAAPMLYGCVALWAVICDVPDGTFRNTPVGLVRALILRSFAELWRHPAGLCAAKMDEAAEMLVGGPIGGLLVHMFSSGNSSLT